MGQTKKSVEQDRNPQLVTSLAVLLFVGFWGLGWNITEVVAHPHHPRRGASTLHPRLAHAGFDTRKLTDDQKTKKDENNDEADQDDDTEDEEEAPPNRKTQLSARVNCQQILERQYAMRYLHRRRHLEDAIRIYLRDLGRCGMLRRYDQTRMLIYDYRGCKLVAIQQNTKTSAASLIKPYVMLGVYHRAKRRGVGAHRIPSRLQRHIDRMMRISNNYSTNYLIRSLGQGSSRHGLHYLNRMLPRYSIRRTRLVETIPRGGRTYRNYTTANDLSTLMSRIYQRRAISPSFSQKMLRVMLHSRDNRGKTPYLKHHYDVRAATKTGYTRRTNGVAGIILSGEGLRRRAYNFVAIVTRPLVRANEWLWRRTSTTIIQRLSEMTYQHYLSGFADHEIRRYRRSRWCRR